MWFNIIKKIPKGWNKERQKFHEKKDEKLRRKKEADKKRQTSLDEFVNYKQ